MASSSYRPTDRDILRSSVKVKTTGITETKFKVGEVTYRLFDIGDQRGERSIALRILQGLCSRLICASIV